MRYDPRRGSSNYLGMDMETTNLADAKAATRRVSEAAKTTATRRKRAKTPSRADSDVDKTMAGVPVTARRAPTSSRQPAPAAAPRYAEQPVPAPRPVPSPQQRAYASQGGQVARAARDRLADPFTSIEAIVLQVLAVVLRLIAIALALLVVASVFLSGEHRGALLEALRLTPLVVPPALLGRFVYETPFGGVFRGDLALASIILFCADYICMRFSTSLRYRRERGV